MLDLDHFKQINDRYGHGAGDDVLAVVGGVLTTCPRASDFAGRHGGEEFLILLPDTDSQGALDAAEKVRATIEKTAVPQVDQAITASLGVAAYPTDALDSDTLVRMADRALYAAKRAGRNRVELAMPSSDAADLAEGLGQPHHLTPPDLGRLRPYPGEPPFPPVPESPMIATHASQLGERRQVTRRTSNPNSIRPLA